MNCKVAGTSACNSWLYFFTPKVFLKLYVVFSVDYLATLTSTPSVAPKYYYKRQKVTHIVYIMSIFQLVQVPEVYPSFSDI